MNVVLFLSRVQPDEMEDIMTAGDKGKHSPPGAGNIYAKANEVIVKITGDDTAQTFEVVEENFKPAMNCFTRRKDLAFTFHPACRIR